MIPPEPWKMQNLSVGNFHKFVTSILSYTCSKLANIFKLVMNGWLFSEAVRMQHGHQFLLLSFRHFLRLTL